MHLSEIQAKLKETGSVPDADFPVMDVLLLLGAMDRENVDLRVYRQHIARLHEELALYLKTTPIGRNENVLEYRLKALNAVLLDEFNYHGDESAYDHPDHINMLTVIDLRGGLPVALGTLYYALAEKQGWTVHGLNFPGHFLLRLDEGPARMIIDPFHDGTALDAGKLRALVKKTLGPRAELHHHYYDTVTPRAIVLGFYNLRKIRLVAQGDYKRALQTVTRQMWIAPDEARLYFDAGLIYMKTGELEKALENLQEFVARSSDSSTVSEAQGMIRSLQRILL